MGYQHEYLARTGNAHIAARFLVSHTRFRGITSADEIAYIAHGYDLASDWPKGTSTSFLKHFAPLSFEQGKRISHCADDIWKSVNALLLNVVGRKAVEVPMQHVAQSIETALFRLAKGEDWNTVTCYESWLEMISQTGISDHVRMIYAVT
jgi:hypothetical protein